MPQLAKTKFSPAEKLRRDIVTVLRKENRVACKQYVPKHSDCHSQKEESGREKFFRVTIQNRLNPLYATLNSPVEKVNSFSRSRY